MDTDTPPSPANAVSVQPYRELRGRTTRSVTPQKIAPVVPIGTPYTGRNLESSRRALDHLVSTLKEGPSEPSYTLIVSRLRMETPPPGFDQVESQTQPYRESQWDKLRGYLASWIAPESYGAPGRSNRSFLRSARKSLREGSLSYAAKSRITQVAREGELARRLLEYAIAREVRPVARPGPIEFIIEFSSQATANKAADVASDFGFVSILDDRRVALRNEAQLKGILDAGIKYERYSVLEDPQTEGRHRPK